MLSTITYRDKTGLKEGQCAVYQRSFTKQATQFYSGLIGDYNPVHSGEGENADSATSSNRGIVQGLYVSSIFSSIFGTLLPGSLYRSQTLKFLQPVHTNQTVIGRVDITTIKNIKGKGVLVACNTAVYTKQDDANLEILLHHPPTNGLNIYGAAELWVPSNIQ
jgi:acyl dehydratase